MMAFTRCKFGRKRRLVMAVTCVPIPPDFFDLPLRQMMLPFMGRLPVISQILDITILFFLNEREKLAAKPAVARIICRLPGAGFVPLRCGQCAGESENLRRRGISNTPRVFFSSSPDSRHP